MLGRECYRTLYNYRLFYSNSGYLEELEFALAHELGFGEKINDENWSSVTTGEFDSMVREVIRCGGQIIENEARQLLNKQKYNPKSYYNFGYLFKFYSLILVHAVLEY